MLSFTALRFNAPRFLQSVSPALRTLLHGNPRRYVDVSFLDCLSFGAELNSTLNIGPARRFCEGDAANLAASPANRGSAGKAKVVLLEDSCRGAGGPGDG